LSYYPGAKTERICALLIEWS